MPKTILFHIFHWGLFVSYSACAVFFWDQSTICQQKINLTLCIILLLGIHRCLSLLRYFLKELSLDFEVLVVMLIVFIRNRESSDTCRDTQNQPFQNLSQYAFIFILITNLFYFCLLIFLLAVSYPMIYFCSRFFHTIRPNNFISPFSLTLPQTVSEVQLQRLVIPMNEMFKDEDCGICLSKLGEPISEVPDPMRLICIHHQEEHEVVSPTNGRNMQNNRIIINDGDNTFNNASSAQNLNNNQDINHREINDIQNNINNNQTDLEQSPNGSPPDSRIVNLPNCLHKFHYLCVKQWFKYRATCPLCRHRIPPYLFVNQPDQEGPHKAAAAHD